MAAKGAKSPIGQQKSYERGRTKAIDKMARGLQKTMNKRAGGSAVSSSKDPK